MRSFIEKSLHEASDVLNGFLKNPENIVAIEKAIDLFSKSIESGHHAFSCGNGGSMSDAMHFAEELTGRYKKERKPLPAMAISDPTHITCVGNDYGYDEIFSRHLLAWGKKGDSVLLLSTSGNSKNVLNACETAKSLGINTIALLAKDGGKLKSSADLSIIVPTNETARAQEIHIKIIHIIIEGIEKKLGL